MNYKKECLYVVEIYSNETFKELYLKVDSTGVIRFFDKDSLSTVETPEQWNSSIRRYKKLQDKFS